MTMCHALSQHKTTQYMMLHSLTKHHHTQYMSLKYHTAVQYKALIHYTINLDTAVLITSHNIMHGVALAFLDVVALHHITTHHTNLHHTTLQNQSTTSQPNTISSCHHTQHHSTDRHQNTVLITVTYTSHSGHAVHQNLTPPLNVN